MVRSSHSNDSVLDMTNTGKALIIALVLVDVGFISYQLLPKGNHSEAAPDTVTANSVTASAAGSRVDGTHVSAGNVVSTSPSANSTGEITAAPQPVKPAPIANDAQARPQTSRHKQPGRALAPADARESVAAKADTAQPVAHARADLTRHGSNAVAAAMTEQLVKESSKPDPSLPMPPQTQAQTQTQTQSAPVGQDHHGSNPVGAAMTQALVRESARVNPASSQTPSTTPTGTQ
jgi:hypothetical protein